LTDYRSVSYYANYDRPTTRIQIFCVTLWTLSEVRSTGSYVEQFGESLMTVGDAFHKTSYI
jgi:hypothetical protein